MIKDDNLSSNNSNAKTTSQGGRVSTTKCLLCHSSNKINLNKIKESETQIVYDEEVYYYHSKTDNQMFFENDYNELIAYCYHCDQYQFEDCNDTFMADTFIEQISDLPSEKKIDLSQIVIPQDILFKKNSISKAVDFSYSIDRKSNTNLDSSKSNNSVSVTSSLNLGAIRQQPRAYEQKVATINNLDIFATKPKVPREPVSQKFENITTEYLKRNQVAKYSSVLDMVVAEIKEYKNTSWKGMYPDKYTLRFDDCGYITKSLPGTTFTIFKNPTNHKHPIGQKLRDIAESMMTSLVSETYPLFIRLGIGDNLPRNLLKEIPGHSINKIMNNQDLVRQENYRNYFEQSDSTFKSQISVCYCGKYCDHAKTYLAKAKLVKGESAKIIQTSVESNYYKGLFEQDVQLLWGNTIDHSYFVAAVFANTNYKYVKIINGEGYYCQSVIEDKLMVHMLMRDNPTGYVHQAIRYAPNKYITKDNYRSGSLNYILGDKMIVTRLKHSFDTDENYSLCIFERYATEIEPEEPNFYDIVSLEVPNHAPLEKVALNIQSVVSLKREEGKTIIDKWMEMVQPKVVNLLHLNSGSLFTYNGSLFVANKNIDCTKSFIPYRLVEESYCISTDVHILDEIICLVPTVLTESSTIALWKTIIREKNIPAHKAVVFINMVLEIYSLMRITIKGFGRTPLVMEAFTGEVGLMQQATNINDKSLHSISQLVDVVQQELSLARTVEKSEKQQGMMDKLIQHSVELPDWWNNTVEAINHYGERMRTKAGILFDNIKNAKIRFPKILPTYMFAFIFIIAIHGVGATTHNKVEVIEDHTESLYQIDYIKVGIILCKLIFDLTSTISIISAKNLSLFSISKGLIANFVCRLVAWIITIALAKYEFMFVIVFACIIREFSGSVMCVSAVTYYMLARISCNPGQVIAGTCTPNDVGEFVMEMLTNNILSTADSVIEEATISTNKTAQQLCICDGNNESLLKQKSPLFQGNVCNNRPYFLHNCICNLTESVYRQNSCTIQPDQEVLKEFTEWYRKNWINYYIREASLSQHSIDFVTWLSKYTGPKLLKYVEAYNRYLDASYKSLKCTCKKTLGKICDCLSYIIQPKKMKMFSKTNEKCFINYAGDLKVKARTVTEQDDICKVIMGPFISYVSKIIKDTDCSYGSGLNYEERSEKFSQWIAKYTDYVVICIDGSAFDSTQHYWLLMATDVELYQQLIDMNLVDIQNYCNPSDLRNVCTELIQEVKCKDFRYTLHGTVPSGKMNTSEANTRRSAAYVRFIAYKSGLVEGLHYNFETCGDDVIIIMSRQHKEVFLEAAYKYVYSKAMPKYSMRSVTRYGLGQIAKKIDVYDSIEQADYISCHFLLDDTGRVKMIRQLDRMLQLTPWTTSNLKHVYTNEDTLNRQLMRGDALEIFSWAGDITLLREIGLMYQRLASDVMGVIVEVSNEYSKRLDTRLLNINAAFERYCERKYNISLDDISDLIHKIRNTTSQYDIIQSNLIDKMFNYDIWKFDNVWNQARGEKKLIFNKGKYRTLVGDNRLLDYKNVLAEYAGA